MTWQNYSPIGAAASAIGASLGAQAQAKQQAIENQRQQQRDAQDAAWNLAQMQLTQQQIASGKKTKESDSAIDAWKKNAFKDMPKIDPNHPEAAISWYYKKGSEALAIGDSATANSMFSAANQLSQDPSRFAEATYKSSQSDVNKARVPMIQAQTDYIRGWHQRFAETVANDKRKATQARINEADKASALASRLANSLQIAGIHEAGAQQRAQMSVDARETIAYMAQDFVLSRKLPAEEAAKAAITQYQAQLGAWRQQNAAGEATALATGEPYTPPPAPTFQPNITVNAPAQQSQMPQIIMVPIQTPDGQIHMHPQVVQPQSHHATPGKKPAAKPTPTHSAPVNTSNENPFQRAGDWLHSLWAGNGQ